jgi:hypothetical protein
MAIDIRPATTDRWDDLVAVFGRRGQDSAWSGGDDSDS